MWILLIESLIVGFIFWVMGTIIFNLSINKNNNENKYKKPYGIDLAFFTTGIIPYIILDLIGLNK
jgi:hypothetical protein